MSREPLHHFFMEPNVRVVGVVLAVWIDQFCVASQHLFPGHANLSALASLRRRTMMFGGCVADRVDASPALETCSGGRSMTDAGSE
jgi:hypothetical protein